VIEIREPADWSLADRALARLAEYDWLVFTSSNGVHSLIRRLCDLGADLRALGHLKLAAIGPATADALRHYHLQPDLVPPVFRSENLAQELQQRIAGKGKRVLIARADRGREILKTELSLSAHVDEVAVYCQADIVEGQEAFLQQIRRGAIDFVTLTSSNIARAFVRRLDPACREQISRGKVRLVSISPVTSQTIQGLDLPVAAEAREYTAEGLVAALLDQVRQTTANREEHSS
jgi:uroporphyrinogen III methyltransferase/synthase